MLMQANKRPTLSWMVRFARDGVAQCVVTIILLALSSLTFAEYRSLGLRQAESNPIVIRISTTYDDLVSTDQIVFVLQTQAPRWLRANRMELGIGAMSQSDKSRPIASLGPVWRWIPATVTRRWYVDFGISPTVLGGARFNSKDLGGHLQFTSSLAIGRRFGAQSGYTVSLRIQHISNGGLDSTNPGVDLIGLGFAYSPERRQIRQHR